MQKTLTTKELREMITRLENQWYKTKEDYAELHRLRRHFYQKQSVRLRELEMQNS